MTTLPLPVNVVSARAYECSCVRMYECMYFVCVCLYLKPDSLRTLKPDNLHTHMLTSAPSDTHHKSPDAGVQTPGQGCGDHVNLLLHSSPETVWQTASGKTSVARQEYALSDFRPCFDARANPQNGFKWKWLQHTWRCLFWRSKSGKFWIPDPQTCLIPLRRVFWSLTRGAHCETCFSLVRQYDV